MRHDDSLADNLFGRLFSYTPRVGREPLEDFCTEALAWCLRESDTFRTEFYGLVKNRLGASLPDLEKLKVETQVGFKCVKDTEAEENCDPKSGRFDLVVRSCSSEIILIFENKVNSDFSQSQIPRYRQELDRLVREYNEGFLVTLTRDAIPAGSVFKDKLDAELLWSEVHQILNALSHTQPGDPAVCSMIMQFEEFLKSRGMYYMKMPKITDKDSFENTVSFCHAIQQILTQATADLPEVRGSVLLQESKDGKELWIQIGNSLCLAFKIEPTLELRVESKCDFKPPSSLELPLPPNMTYHHWETGFGIHGNFIADEMNGNPVKIRAWFDEAVREALKIRNAIPSR